MDGCIALVYKSCSVYSSCSRLALAIYLAPLTVKIDVFMSHTPHSLDWRTRHLHMRASLATFTYTITL